MKRDARIGLAVILVLGLTVTLLIARAINKRSELAREDGEPPAPGAAAPYSAEPSRVDGANATQVSPSRSDHQPRKHPRIPQDSHAAA